MRAGLNMTQCSVYTETKALSTPPDVSFVVIDTCNHPMLTWRTIMQYLETRAPVILRGKMQDLYLLFVEVCLRGTWEGTCRISHTQDSSVLNKVSCTFSLKQRVGFAIRCFHLEQQPVC